MDVVRAALQNQTILTRHKNKNSIHSHFFNVHYILCSVSQEEIEALYKRFRTLDRGRKVRHDTFRDMRPPPRPRPRLTPPPHTIPIAQGFITADEFLSIPELSINPLAKRLAFFYDGINFREFVKLLAPCSPNASREEKVRLLFAIWDVDGDGFVSRGDMELIIRQAGGTTLSDEEIAVVVGKVMAKAGAGRKGLGLPEFRTALDTSPVALHVEVPVGY